MEGARAHFSNGSWYSQVYLKVAISKLLEIDMWRYSSKYKWHVKSPKCSPRKSFVKTSSSLRRGVYRGNSRPSMFSTKQNKIKTKTKKKRNRSESVGWWYVNLVLWIQDHMKDFYQINILIGLHLVLKQRLCSLLSTRTRINVSRSLRNSLPFDAWWSVRFFTAPCRSERSMTADLKQQKRD